MVDFSAVWKTGVDLSRFRVLKLLGLTLGLWNEISLSMNSANALDKRPDITGQTDEDLLQYMAKRGEDPSVAEEAWAEFYRRHGKYLYDVCCRAYSGFVDKATLSDLVSETLLKVFEKAGTFKPSGFESPDEKRAWVRAWLGTIAENELFSGLRRQEGVQLDHLSDKQWADIGHPVAEGVDAETPSRRLELITEALEQLPDRERYIVLVTMAYYRPGRNHQRLPNDVSHGLARMYDTTPENIRKIRQRSLQTIEEYVQSSLQVG